MLLQLICSANKLKALDSRVWVELANVVRARKPMHLTVEELVEVVEWKMTRGIWRPRNKQLAAGNSPEATREATERGLALASGTVDPAVFQEALEAIAELKGIGPATASAVLSLAYPERVPFFDEAMAKAIPGLGPVQFTTRYCCAYTAQVWAKQAELSATCEHGPWSCRSIEKALWAFSVSS